MEVFSKAGSSRPARLWANSRSSSLYSLDERGPKGSSGSLISRWADSSEPSTLGSNQKETRTKNHFMKLSLARYKHPNNKLEEASIIFNFFFTTLGAMGKRQEQALLNTFTSQMKPKAKEGLINSSLGFPFSKAARQNLGWTSWI